METAERVQLPCDRRQAGEIGIVQYCHKRQYHVDSLDWTFQIVRFSRKKVGNQRIEDGTQFERCPADPIGKSRAVEIDALAAHDLGLPI